MTSKQKTILVVDDEQDILEFLQELLEMKGYSVAITDKAEHIEKQLDENPPDLIILDVLLPGRDGREIVRGLKSREETRHVPVIMFSAYPDAETTSLAAGADDFLVKPFGVKKLLAIIARHI